MGAKEKLRELGLSEFIKYVDELEKENEYWIIRWSYNGVDCSTAILMKLWQVTERTIYNYRKQGLQYYKKGRRFYYTPEARRTFLQRNKI